MDIKNNTTYRNEEYKKFNFVGENKYDYRENGILIKCLPKILFKGNTVLVTFIQLLDLRLIMLLDYIDKLKRFKYITWYD